MRKKTILVILISLLIITLAGLCAWYLLIFRCNQIPSNYKILERFVTSNSCQKTTISLQGTLYNMRWEGNDFLFDLGAWDKETKESVEIKDMKIPYTEDVQKELADTKYMAPVDITLDIQKSYKYQVLLEESGVEVWGLKKITYDKERIYNTLTSLLQILENKELEIKGKTFDIPILSSFEEGNGTLNDLRTIGYRNLASIYRPYIQILTRENENTEINSLQKEEFKLTEYMSSLQNFLTEELKSSEQDQSNIDKEEIDEGEIFLSSYSYFGACSLVKEIANTTELSKEEETLLVDEYCNFGDIDEILTNIKKLTFRYTIDDLIGNMNMYNLQTKDRPLSDKRLANPYFASDLLSSVSLKKDSETSLEDIYNLASLSLANSLLNETDRDIKDYCELMYSEYLVEKNFDIERNIPKNMLRILLDQDISKMVKYMSEDIESGLICMLPEDNDEYVKEFKNAILNKYLLVDVFTGQGKDNGIWDRNMFRITDNARLYELLLKVYEN